MSVFVFKINWVFTDMTGELVGRGTEYPVDLRLQELRQELESHDGQFVLVITRVREPSVRYVMPQRDYRYRTRTDYYLGILEPPFLRQRHGFFEIHTSKFVTLGHLSGDEKVYVTQGSLGFTHPFLFIDFLGLPLDQKDPRPVLEIVAGDQKVGEYFQGLAEMGMPRTGWVSGEIRRQYFNPNPLITFNKMQLALERLVVPLPQDIAEERRQKIEEEKINIVAWLEKLVGQEIFLSARLEEIELSLIGHTTVMGNRQIILRDIQSRLRQAMALGMHKTPWTIQRDRSPGRQEIVNVPQFIRDLCERYEVPLVKSGDSSS